MVGARGAGWGAPRRGRPGGAPGGGAPPPRPPPATAHFAQTGHRLMRSYEPGEDWYWDYVTAQAFDGPEPAPPLAHPEDQTTPGPASRVPANWRELIH